MVLVLVVSSLDLRKFFAHLLFLVGYPSLFGPCPSGLNPGSLLGCPSRFGPCPSGLNPGGGFFSVFFFLFHHASAFPLYGLVGC